MKEAFTPGQVFEIAYPFVWDTRDDFEPDSGEAIKVRYWRPGHINRDKPNGDVYGECDAFGVARFKCINICRPSPYPSRVFFTREFCSPSGVWFGKNNLRIATVGKFRRLISGYRIKCDLSGLKVAV